ncbi:MAG: CDP-diacylglycerol--glycerol-3-phosphate 3-phosphatidyltransferase [candidate division NC10 bacterium]|nr:CDP-diacylglycerol--glycerol-3-phosphate 3-phosphatidyltransferase [candidate division NC10 bacterium]
MRRWALSIPNLLSATRIVAMPLIVLLLFFPDRTTSVLAALLFSLACLTDFLDGYIARRYQLVTSIGKLLDTLADKLLILAPMIMLVALKRIPAWMVVVIVWREMAVMALREAASRQGAIIQASQLGKAKTTLQDLALIFLLLHYPYFSIDFHVIGLTLLWFALLITVWSGVEYFLKFWQVAVKS